MHSGRKTNTRGENRTGSCLLRTCRGAAPEPEPTSGPEVGPTLGPEPETTPGPEVGPAAGPDPDSGVGLGAGPEVGPTAGPYPGSELGPAAGPDPDSRVGPGAGPEPEPGADARTPWDPEVGPGLDLDHVWSWFCPLRCHSVWCKQRASVSHKCTSLFDVNMTHILQPMGRFSKYVRWNSDVPSIRG